MEVKISMIRYCVALCGTFLIGCATGLAHAQPAYPVRPVTVVVPFAVGSQVDLLVRTLSEQFSKALNQPFVVLNRDGAGGVIAVASVAQAKPDGYTLGYGTQGPFTIQPNLRKDLQYKFGDFEFICQSNTTSLIVAVGPKSAFSTLRELVDAARKAPGTLSFASVGVGTGPHLIAESLALEAGVRFNHIPYRSIADMTAQFIGGTVDFVVTTPILLASRKDVRALAVAGNQRLNTHPQIPLLKELDFKRSSLPGYVGIYAQRGVPSPATAILRKACPVVFNSEPFRKASDSIASPVEYADSAEYTQNVVQDLRSMTDLITALGIKPE